MQVLAGHAVLDIHAAADDHRIQCRRIAQAGVRSDLQAVAGAHRQAALGQGMPAVQLLAGELVGHAQGLDRRGQGDQGEIVQQQEAYGLGSTVLGLRPLAEL
ncbi:hypothetical protein D3C72_2072120 [compost metagenome]